MSVEFFSVVLVFIFVTSLSASIDEIHVSSASDHKNSSCTTWPETIKPLRDCCLLPSHKNDVLMNHCYFKCNPTDLDDEDRIQCAAKCYVNMTLLMGADGKINKAIVKRIYNTNAFFDPKLMKLINESVENCNFESTKSLSKSLAKFYECVNQKLEDNCVTFINTLECDKAQEHFESCRNETYDCHVWPETLIDPDQCCNTPRLFPQNSHFSLNCRKNCSSEELFMPRQVKCIENCLNHESNLKVDGKFDFKVVKNLLLESTSKKEAWEKPITEAAEKCEGKIHGVEASTEHAKSSLLSTCLRDELNSRCVEFIEDSSCNKVARFMKHCPDVKPVKDKMMQAMMRDG